ncbi:cysteine hydrolase family protein [Lysinibacillus piscis]|uniref:Isochorismatase n=1 Tax=Lysinibacillus piscis TaxID=2518931 RepID=A0ABQ5NLN3_9BACI|nr:isochorismatase family cysteine hydrolase [Lysinibacillus sp. KH24]GLC89213.1 isochorismatase [Lysinibacillus sp. KH24]
MKKALLVIDYTYDFVATDGKLTCGEAGQALDGKIAALMQQFVADNEFVVCANDLHEEQDIFHPETKLFPPHNIRGTKGRELYGLVSETYIQHQQRILWLDKTRYSAFAGTNLAILLKERGIEEIHLVGVCTDICVLHTAVDAYNLGISTVIYADGVASFDAAGHEWALRHFEHTLGARVICQ